MGIKCKCSRARLACKISEVGRESDGEQASQLHVEMQPNVASSCNFQYGKHLFLWDHIRFYTVRTKKHCMQAQDGLWDPISIYENLCDIWMTTSYFCFSIWVSILSSHYLLSSRLWVASVFSLYFSMLWKWTVFYCSAAPAEGGPQLLHALGRGGLEALANTQEFSGFTQHKSVSTTPIMQHGWPRWLPVLTALF